MNHAEHCRFQAERSLAEAETTTLGNVRARYLRAATAWQQMADSAERVAIDREAREKARTEIPHARSADHGHVDRVTLQTDLNIHSYPVPFSHVINPLLPPPA